MTDNSWQIARLQLELGIIQNLLNDENYELSGIDFDYESSLTDLAYHIQQEKKKLTQQVNSLEKENHKLKEEIERLKGNKYKEHNYQYIYEDKLNPPNYIPSNEDIKLAKARYAFENEIWEIVYNLIQYKDLLEGKELQYPYTKEMIEKNVKKSVEYWHKSLHNWSDDNDMWDCFINEKWFKTVYIDGLNDYHGGDCTGFASSCPRCHAEDMFKIPSTVTWGKSEGHKMEKSFWQDVKEKRELNAKENKINVNNQENN